MGFWGEMRGWTKIKGRRALCVLREKRISQIFLEESGVKMVWELGLEK